MDNLCQDQGKKITSPLSFGYQVVGTPCCPKTKGVGTPRFPKYRGVVIEITL